jgi:hypothetical protein
MNTVRQRQARPIALAAFLAMCGAAVPRAEAQLVAPLTPPETLRPGEFVWTPDVAPSGPVIVLVSITEQRLYVYRNGVRIAYSTVSTGKPGHETPTGVFTVLEKDRDHVSNLFKGAKMPNMERLTWSGIALHAGNLPGYPASHGCVRLPLEFSRLLFELDPVGTTVVIADEHSGPREGAHPGALLSPMLERGATMEAGAYDWRPERSPTGPLNLLLSTADRTLYVYRNGVEIGRATIGIRGDVTGVPEGVFTVLEGFAATESPFAPGRRDHRWMAVTMGGSAPDARAAEAAVASRLDIPHAFAGRVYDVLAPGSTILVTHAPAAPHVASDEDFVVMATQHERSEG